MINTPADRSQGVLNRAAGGRKSAQNAKKILNRGNEPKNLLKVKGLAFQELKTNPVFTATNPDQSQEDDH
jgi:hypothetical protein